MAEVCRLGAPVCEVFLNAPSQYTPAFGRVCRRIAEDHGTEIVSVHALCSQYEPQLFSPLTSQRKDAADTLRRVLEAGAEMDVRVHTFHGTLYYHNRLPTTTDYALLAGRAFEVLEIYREFNMTLAWENVYYAAFHRPEFCEQMTRALPDSRHLGFCLDVKQAVLGDEDPLAFLQAMGPKLTHVHLCDVANRKPKLPGQGDVDFAALAGALRQTNPEVPVLLEVYAPSYQTTGEVGDCMRAMQEIFKDG